MTVDWSKVTGRACELIRDYNAQGIRPTLRRWFLESAEKLGEFERSAIALLAKRGQHVMWYEELQEYLKDRFKASDEEVWKAVEKLEELGFIWWYNGHWTLDEALWEEYFVMGVEGYGEEFPPSSGVRCEA